MKRILLILFFLFLTVGSFAQADTAGSVKTDDTATAHSLPAVKKFIRRIITDTLKKQVSTDTVKKSGNIAKTDSASPGFADTAKPSLANTTITNIALVSVKKPIDSIYRKLLKNPFINFNARPLYLVIHERERQSKDETFYLLSGLLLFLAFIKLVFSRYFKNIFRLFFQPSFRQKQTREQLLQNNLPSLLLNLFFIFSAAAYISFLLQYYHRSYFNYWLLLLYIVAALLILYVGKYIFLSFTGWVFDVKQAANAYIFSVYLINKILGVILIPFTLLIAFSQPFIIDISITISGLLILLLYIYRYLVSYAPVHKEVRVNALHFLLYILAFEIMPLLLIYKTLNNLFG